MSKTVLEVRNLSVSFRMYEQGLKQKDLKVITDLNMSVGEGEILAIAGSSGSGKSLLAHAVLGILPGNAAVEGEMSFYGREMDQSYKEELRGREIALIPQSVNYLDPLMKVGRQAAGRRGTMDKVRQVFSRYQLEDGVENLYPFQLSGGMARRVLLATAAISDASLVVADEPTPGLSHKMAAEVMQDFRKLADQGKAVVLITHDIDLAIQIADRVAVFYAGTTVEIADTEDFKEGVDALRHPYSKALWQALPQNGFRPVKGTQPYAGSLPSGCLYADRCERRDSSCAGQIKMRNVRGGEVCCVHAT